MRIRDYIDRARKRLGRDCSRMETCESGKKDPNLGESSVSPAAEIEETGNDLAHEMIGDPQEGEVDECGDDSDQGPTHFHRLRRQERLRGRTWSAHTSRATVG